MMTSDSGDFHDGVAAAIGDLKTNANNTLRTSGIERMTRRLGTTLLCCALAFGAPLEAAQTTFATPQAAVEAVVAAIKADRQASLLAMLGPHGERLLRSGDRVADEQNRATFLKQYGAAHRITLEGNSRAILSIGSDDWPLPIPLVRSNDSTWRFDVAAGEQEVLARRIGRNELSAIQVSLAIVDAERDYSARDIDRDGLREYAARITSRHNRRDGLYWANRPGEPASPLGPLLAAAAREGYGNPWRGALAPYHGYHYRILSRQGKHAAGGAYHYVVKGKMLAGFALIAYPARHGVSGIMSFVVNQDGLVYQKNLGPNTTAIASAYASYNPDQSWKRAAAPERLSRSNQP